LPTDQTTSSSTYDTIQPSKPDVVYADIVPGQKPGYTNDPSNNDGVSNDTVVYSELLSRQ